MARKRLDANLQPRMTAHGDSDFDRKFFVEMSVAFRFLFALHCHTIMLHNENSQGAKTLIYKH
jgi:hypothetical protein